MKWVCLFFIALLSIATVHGTPIKEENEIEYQPLPFRQFLDIVRPDGIGSYPAVMVLHGGGFRGGSRSDVHELCRRLANSGFVAVAVDYRLPPAQLFPAPLNDLKSAIRWVRANAARLSVDSERIGVLGIDSGGYLAVLAALTNTLPEFEGIGPLRALSSRILCAVAIDALLDPAELDTETHSALVGGVSPDSLIDQRRANPLNWITPDAVPILLLGTPKASTYEFLTQMSRVGVESSFAKAASGPRETENQAISFLHRQLAAVPQTSVVVADHGPLGQVLLMEWPSGRELWHASNHSGHDAQLLPNGDILATLEEDGSVVEYDPRQPQDGNIVWSYGHAEGLKLPISAERLANGNTLIADTGLGELIEISPEKKVVWRYSSPELANNRMRHCRRTSSGTTLIAVEAASKIIEVNHSGQIVWSWTAPGSIARKPYQAMRLENGNTIISLMTPGEVVEVNPAGKILKSIGGNGRFRIGWASGFDLLPNGNLLVADYTGQRLLEVDKSGAIAHEVKMDHRPATIEVAH